MFHASFKCGNLVPSTGLYFIVGPNGRSVLGIRRCPTSTPFPPTPVKGCRFVAVVALALGKAA